MNYTQMRMGPGAALPRLTAGGPLRQSSMVQPRQQQQQQFADDSGEEEDGGMFAPQQARPPLDPFMAQRIQTMLNRQRQMRQPAFHTFQNTGSADILSGQRTPFSQR